MNFQNSIRILLEDRERVLAAKAAAIVKFDTEIDGLEKAIKTLSGKNAWENPPATIYDDEHPDYIKASIED